MTLRQRTIDAVQWTTVSAVLRGGGQLMQLTVLARFLEPVEFGKAAAVTAIISVGSILSDLGVNGAYLYTRHVEEQQRSALYWLNVFAGFSMTLLILAVSPLADFATSGEHIGSLLRTYSLVFLISALGLQLRFDAEKRLEFRRVAVIEVLSTFLGVFCTVSFAAAGQGAAAIIYGALAAASANMSLNWMFLSAGWHPQLIPHFSQARPFLRFGLANIGNGLLNQFSTSLDMLIGGRILGMGEFGLYSAPRNLFNQVLTLINPIITRVGFPLVAHLENDRKRIARLYQRMLRAIVGINAPLYLFAALFSEPLVHLLFGDRWIAMTGAFQALALWGLSRSIMNPVGNLLFGMGRPGLALKWNLCQTGIAFLVLPLAEGYGALGMALIVLALIGGQILPSWYLLVHRLCDLSLGAFLSAILRPVICALAAAYIADLVAYPIKSDLIKLLVGVSVAAPLYTAASWFSREEWLMLILVRIGIEPAR